MRRHSRLILTILVLAAIGWYVRRARFELIAVWDNLEWRRLALLLAPMLAVHVLSLWVNGWVGRELAAELGVKLGGVEAFALASAHSMANYLPVPQAGAVVRGLYLKRLHNLPYATYAASVLVTYVTGLAIWGGLGLVCLAAFAARGARAPWQLWTIFALLVASLVMFTPLSARIPTPRRLAEFNSGMRRLGRGDVLLRIVVLQGLLAALTATGLWLACLALPGGHRVTWVVGLILALLMLASGVAKMTPGNIGIEQAAAAGGAHLLGIEPTLGLLASAIFRATAAAVVFTLGPVMTHRLQAGRVRVRGADAGRHGGPAAVGARLPARGVVGGEKDPDPPGAHGANEGLMT
jgi:hypothetical protein